MATKHPAKAKRWPTVVAVTACLVSLVGAVLSCCLLVAVAPVEETLIEVEETIVEELEPAEPLLQITIDGDAVYTEDLSGLPEAIAGRFGAADYSVMLYDLHGDSVLEIAADRQFTAASTYKLFVAYMMLSEVENGALSWNSTLAGTTLSNCFDRMIIDSDNDCPLAYLDRVSYTRANATVRDLGMTSTTLAYDMRTTARDLAGFLALIYYESILSPSSNDRLIDTMTRQAYREGIPAGVGDRGVVADKVGFLDGYLNDAGIVYRADGDYVLVILTSGSSWRAIADVTALIDAWI